MKAEPRSKPSVAMAMRHPSPGAPTIMCASVRAPSKNTSQKWSPPVISTSGRTSMPAWSRGTRRNEMPACLGPSVDVRHRTKIQSAYCAWLVQTFWPSMTHSLPSSRARVLSAARSLPAFGSLNPWHQNSSPRRIGGRKRACCSGVPKWMSVGPSRPSPKVPPRVGPSARAYSSANTSSWIGDASRPPWACGHDRPIQPPRPSSCSHATSSFQVSPENSAPVPSAANSPTRWRSSQSRTSSRKRSSSAE